MSLVGLNTSADCGPALGVRHPFDGDGFKKFVTADELNQFTAAELVAERWGIEREAMERLALESHQRAAAAADEGRFEHEIVPYGEAVADEGIRRDTSMEKMASLGPIRPGGRVTAAMASQIADGAAALLIASEEAVARHGLRPLARLHTMVVTGADPVAMLTAPIPATQKALARAGLTIDDIDLFECNEAFAPVVLAWEQETGAPHERVNVNGGGISLGHPLGATGARLMTTLVHELGRRGARYGLQVMCEGGGLSNATIVERLG
jgi:acetyl-CoA C-acetyltransferase